MKKTERSVDYGLFFSAIALIIFWMIMISSVSVYFSHELTLKWFLAWEIAEPYNHFYVIRNIFHVIAGFVVMAVVVKIKYSFFEKYSPHFLGLTTLLLWYVHFWGETYKWAKWWIDIPLLPFNIQPTELLKFSLIIFLAAYFKKNLKYISTFSKWFVPFMWILWLFVFIVWMQPDFGTVMVIVPVSFIMFFLIGANVRYLSLLALIGLVWVYGIYSAWKYEKWVEDRPKLAYITERMDYFLQDSKLLFEPESIANPKTYQIRQSLTTIWSWGIFWLWFGQSIQKFGYLPEVQWDFIFSVIVEELWFLWAFVVLSLYVYIAYRWFHIYMWVQDVFAKMVAAGISSWFIVQAFINIGVNINVVPLTGITLPFVSYWWSSLLTLMLALWLLLNISRYRYEKPKYNRLSKRIYI